MKLKYDYPMDDFTDIENLYDIKKMQNMLCLFKIKPNASFLAFIVVRNYMENIKFIEKANNNER
jgi:hypothetical protein